MVQRPATRHKLFQQPAFWSRVALGTQGTWCRSPSETLWENQCRHNVAITWGHSKYHDADGIYHRTLSESSNPFPEWHWSTPKSFVLEVTAGMPNSTECRLQICGWVIPSWCYFKQRRCSTDLTITVQTTKSKKQHACVKIEIYKIATIYSSCRVHIYLHYLLCLDVYRRYAICLFL